MKSSEALDAKQNGDSELPYLESEKTIDLSESHHKTLLVKREHFYTKLSRYCAAVGALSIVNGVLCMLSHSLAGLVPVMVRRLQAVDQLGGMVILSTMSAVMVISGLPDIALRSKWHYFPYYAAKFFLSLCVCVCVCVCVCMCVCVYVCVCVGWWSKVH